MELAVNTFAKGLQNDTHPMVQGSDTLSDALNATFITMNGNEVVLLNDMGNRRVDNAYLPNGYEPVGIKEYGGIIYIAAYNPITNKSLIGSFPSPERKIGIENTNNTSITLNTAFDKKAEHFGESFESIIYFLQNDTALFPLTNDTFLHAGDKFVVYTTNKIEEAENGDITNYFNTRDGKVISPKNKLYTLALGILNSLNEFVDITNTLARWEGTNKLIYTDESSLYLFNDKYFIAIANDDSNFRNTIDDNALIQERLLGMLIQNANTYAYKLVGPLYLKATLNHVLNFTYNIYGTKNQNEVTLWIVGNYIYNCPDGTSGLETDEGDDDYLKYDIGYPKKPDFSFTFETNPSSSFIDETNNQNILDKYPKYTVSTYDKSQNLYKVTITNKYSINISNPEKNIVNYRILVKANSESSFYLKGLSDYGVIDISKLGSGELGVKGWRFLNSLSNNNNMTNLTYVLDAYPKYGEEFTNLRIHFKELEAKNDINAYLRIMPDSTGKAPDNITSLPYIEGTAYNGRNNISFYWSEVGLKKRTIYDIYITYKINGGEKTYLLSEDNRWFITTELFNNWYDVNDSLYTTDFCKADRELLENKLNVTIKANSNSTLTLNSPIIVNDGNYFSTTNSNIKFTTKQTIKGTNIISPKFYIENENLYPSDLVISDEANSKLIIDDITNNESTINGKIERYTENTLDEIPGVFVTTNLSSNKKSFSIETIITDSFLATSKSGAGIEVTNVYDTIRNLINTVYNSAEGIWNHYSGPICDFTEHTGPDDEHHIRVIVNASISKEEWESRAGQYNLIKLISRDDDDPIEFYMSEIKGLFFDAMNLNPDTLIFTYLVSTYPGSHIVTRKGDWSNDLKGTKVELWWRGTLNTWVVSKLLVRLSNGVVSSGTIANIFDEKAIMCCYKTKPDNMNIYIADNYNANKRFNDILNIIYKLKYTDTQPSNIISNKIYNTQLQFNPIPNLEDESILIDITSSEEFLDKVNLALNVTSISNVFRGNGSTVDSNNDPLCPNKIYLLSNDKLYYNSSSKIYVDSESSDTYYFPLYNGFSAGTPNYIKHCGADEDSDTYLNFSGINSFNTSNIS